MGNDLRGGRRKSGGSGGGNAPGNINRLDKLTKSREQFDLSRLDASRLLTVIGIAIENGGAIRVGLTRDGGALAIGVYSDGSAETVYLNGKDDQDEFWDAIESVYK